MSGLSKDKMLELSPALQKVVEKITLNSNEPIAYKIKIKLISGIKKDIVIEVPRLDRIDVSRKMAENFMDYIDIDFQLTRRQFIQIMKNPQDLICFITYTPWDTETDDVLKDSDNKPVKDYTEKYRIIFSDKTDIYKQFTESQVQADLDDSQIHDVNMHQYINVSAQLIGFLEYEIRKVGINAILRDVTVKDVITWLCYRFSIPKLRLVEPDNKRVYTNFIIPPMKYIDDIFTWIQQSPGFGVYNNGLSYYLLDDTLYVYPQYKTDIESKFNIKFYKIPNMISDDISGILKEKDTLSVGLQFIPDLIDNSESAYENVGTAFLVHHLGKVIKNSYETKEDFIYHLFEDNTSLFLAETNRGIASETYTPRHMNDYENSYSIKSLLKATNLATVLATVHHLHYKHIKPADKIEYIYDGDGHKMLKKSGQILASHTIIARPKVEGYTDLFTMTTTVMLYIENDLTEIDTPLDAKLAKP